MAEKINLDPQTIVDQEFDIDFKGYNPEQVDRMLDQIIQDYQTFQKLVTNLRQKITDLERTNASLRAKLIELEGKVKAAESDDPIQAAAANVDILKRLSRLEKQVFADKNKQQ
jgi:DivIVA domain-containing protein